MRNVPFFLIFVFVIFLMSLLQNSDSFAKEKRPDDSGSISGRVTIKGKPTAGIEIALSVYDVFPINEMTKTVTDEKGDYQFNNLESKTYWVKILAPEYIIKGEYDDEGVGKKVALVSGEKFDKASFDLIRGCVISGRVVDVDGKPIADERVELFQITNDEIDDEVFWLNNNDDKTDAQGNYRLHSVPPGRYLIAVGDDIAKIKRQKRSPMGGDHFPFNRVIRNRYFAQTFYGNVTDSSKAKVITLNEESELRDINIKMLNKGFRAYTVSGKVIDEKTGEPLKKGQVYIGNLRDGEAGSGDMAETDEVGNFEIDGLLECRFYASAGFEEDSELVSDRVDFTVKDKDITGITIRVSRGMTIQGSLVIEGGSRERALEILAQNEFRAVSRTIPGLRKIHFLHDGTFLINGLPKGSIEFWLFSRLFDLLRIEHPNAKHTNEVKDSPFSRPDDWVVELGEDSLTDVRLVLKYKSGVIKGQVEYVGELPSKKPQLGVAIKWKTERILEAGTSRDIDSNGKFFIDGLEPGDYTLSIYDRKGFRSEPKTVKVTSDSQVPVLFTIDLSKLKKS
ncbi:MAG: carboxypeptidase-like regulatory domain-containing protein [Acidobacteriota bacterium]